MFASQHFFLSKHFAGTTVPLLLTDDPLAQHPKMSCLRSLVAERTLVHLQWVALLVCLRVLPASAGAFLDPKRISLRTRLSLVKIRFACLFHASIAVPSHLLTRSRSARMILLQREKKSTIVLVKSCVSFSEIEKALQDLQVSVQSKVEVDLGAMLRKSFIESHSSE